MKQHGFTLIEVLVAIAIFAVLSAAGWQVFDQLIKNRERNQQHSQQLMLLQTAYSQLLRDIHQIAPVSGKQAGQNYPALALEAQQLQFNRSGVIDPLQQGLDQFEFIDYRYDEQQKALLRYKSAYIYRQDIQNLQSDVILAPIEELRFRALDPAIQDRWPAQSVTDTEAEQYMMAQLPKGVEVTFTYHGQPVRWVFALIQALPVSQSENSQQQGSNNADS